MAAARIAGGLGGLNCNLESMMWELIKVNAGTSNIKLSGEPIADAADTQAIVESSRW